VIALPKPGKDPKFPQNLRPISLLPSTGKVFEKVILEIVKRHIRENNLLNASQFGFRARHSTTLQCMRLADHLALHFNNNMSTAGPPLRSSGQSSWLQIRRTGFDSRHYQIFREKKRKTVVGLKRGPISLVSTTEELLDRKVAAPVLKTRSRDPSR
jgi:hypothetical protein